MEYLERRHIRRSAPNVNGFLDIHPYWAGRASLYPFGPLGPPLRFFSLLQGWHILTNFKVPVLADTLLALSFEGSRQGLSRSIQTTYK